MDTQTTFGFKKLSRILIFLTLISLLISCNEDNSGNINSNDILYKIRSLEGVEVVEIMPQYGYSRAFQINVTQPVDHNNPSGDQYTQRIYLSHVNENMPMVFAPSGYATSSRSGQEIASILGTNCMNVTHRYFNDSKPDPLDWQYLTIEQAAADHHRIVELFKNMYNDKWISSGVSKSGQAVLFHRRFYPDDVDVTIAYVAPFVFGPKDMRFADYIETIGESDCFTKLKEFQRLVLQNRTDILPYVNGFMHTNAESWSLDSDLILELAVMDYPFYYWQYNDIDCSYIPNSSSTNAELFNHLNSIVSVSGFSDENNEFYAPYVYQALTETGAPGYKTDYLSDLLINIDPLDEGNPNFEILAPQNATLTFNYSTLTDIYSWLQTSGNNIIYIYGDQDPWTAGAIELTGQTNALFILQEGANHRVKIADLDEQQLVYSTLEEWLDIEISSTKSYMYTEPEPDIGFRLR
ncbi:S28 family serine protease [Bacteroidota bacterium]